MRTIIAALLLFCLACQADQRPQALEPQDACAGCRMAISQSRYAAQVVDRDGVALKFDDIGCMRRYLREHQPAQARIYVMDYVNQQWLAAEAAVYVRSKTIESPMASGLAAFRDQPAASRFLRENDGALTSFPELMTRESGATQHADQHR